MVAPAEQFGREPLRVVPTHEQPSGPQNTFVAFLDAQREGLDKLSQATSELKRLVKEHRDSPLLTPYIAKYTEMVMWLKGDPRTQIVASVKKKGRWEEKTREALLYDTHGKALSESLASYKQRYPHREKETDDFVAEVVKVVQVFEQERYPLKTTATGARRDLFSALVTHLGKDVVHLFDTAEFLSFPEHALRREGIRPFLTLLADHVKRARNERVDSMFTTAGNEWVENFTQDPPKELLVEFFGEDASKIAPELAEWIVFAIAMAKKIDPENKNLDYADNMTTENIMDVFPSILYWPKKLVDLYVAFLRKKVNGSVSAIHTELEQFAKTESSVPTVVFRAEPVTKEANGGVTSQTVSGNAEGEEEAREQEKKLFGFGIFIPVQIPEGMGMEIRIITDDELDKFLVREANKLAPHDKKMVDDLGVLIEDLCKDPTGDGIKQMKQPGIKIGQDYLPIFRYSARGRGSEHLSQRLQHKKTRDLRIVFAVDRRDPLKPRIVLEGIYTHSRFMRKYSMGTTVKE